MSPWAFLVSVGLPLVACEGGEIAIFSTQLPGSSGAAGDAGTSSTSGASSAGMAGVAGEANLAGTSGLAGGDAGSGSASGSGGSGDPPCRSGADCDTNYFCSKQRCEDMEGSCQLLPFPNDALDLQVCGCDGITYWNDSYRQRFGIAASTMGPCNASPRTCMNDQECGLSNYSCEHFLPPNAACGGPPSLGRCWVTPPDCPVPATDDRQYQVCQRPSGSGGGGPPCVTKCQAIQSGRPFTQLSHDQVCP